MVIAFQGAADEFIATGHANDRAVQMLSDLDNLTTDINQHLLAQGRQRVDPPERAWGRVEHIPRSVRVRPDSVAPRRERSPPPWRPIQNSKRLV